MNPAPRHCLWLVVLALSVWLPVARGAGSESSLPLSQVERAWLAAHPLLRVGVAAADWSPIDEVGPGTRYQGISADYLDLVAHRAGFRWQLETQPDFAGVLERARAGAIDLIPSTARTPERDAYLTYSAPYLTVTPVFVTRRDDTAFSAQSDLHGLRLAQPRGFATNEALRRRYPDAQVVEVADVAAALRAVSTGAADVYAGALPPTAFAVERNLLSNLAVRGEAPLGTGELRFAMPKSDAILAGIIDKAIASISADEHRAIRARWSPVRLFLGDTRNTLQLNAAEQAWLRAHPHIRVGFDRDFAPFSSVGANGEPVGLSADYLALLGARLGVHLEPASAMPFGTLLDKLEHHEVDLGLALVRTSERARRLAFVGPYLTTPTAIVTRLNEPGVVELADLAGRRVAILRGHYLEDMLRRAYPGIVAVEVANAAEGAAMVARGEVDAMINNLVNVSPLINGPYLGQLKVAATIPSAPSELSFAVRGDWPEFAAMLSRALDSLSPEEQRAIRQKWMTVEYRQNIPWRGVLLVGVPALCALLLVMWTQARSNRRLREEVMRREAVEVELRAARDAAESAARARTAFLSSMSHEIRTPMNGVLGVVDVLARSPLSASQRFSVRVIRDSARALLQILNDVLDFSRIEADRMTLDVQPADLREVVEQTAVLFAAQAQRKGLRFELQVASSLAHTLCFDAGRLRQILANLLSNAFKFCDRGTVGIRIGAEDEGISQCVSIIVADTGIGIERERQATLFQPYVQADAGIAGRFGGTGLGLAISRRLAELMGGTLRLDSQPGRGTQVSLSIRFDVAQRLRPMAGLLRGWHALILDDGRWDAAAAADIIRNCGAEVERETVGEPSTNTLAADAGLVIGTAQSLHALALRGGAPDPVRIEIRLSEVMEIEVVSPRHYAIAGVPLLPSAMEQALRLAADGSGRELERYLRSGLEPAIRRSDQLVLVVDDHPVNLLVLREQLSLLGVDAEYHESAHDALAAWLPHRFALVITDINMPDMDGIAFAHHIREREQRHRVPHVPIVVLSADATPELATRVAVAGMDELLTKPLDIATLSACLDRWLPVTRGDGLELDRTLLESLYGSAERTGRVVQGFLSAMARDVPDLHAAVTMRDPSRVAQVAHRIGGAAQAVALESLGRLVEQLREASNRSGWEEAARLVHAITEMTERLRSVYAAEPAS